jgi:hypothetical protein
MIIQAPSSHTSYSTDATAQSLRAFVAAPALRTVARYEDAAAPARPGRLDFAALYPNLATPAKPRRALPITALRGLAFRLTVIGSTAAMLGLMHH